MKLTGVYAPIITPFHPDESINYPVLEQLIGYLLGNGITGLVPGGTTGEVYAFTEQERLDIRFRRHLAGIHGERQVFDGSKRPVEFDQVFDSDHVAWAGGGLVRAGYGAVLGE